ncbi:MAG: 16S rRNA (uracil(1498)-N(3))-methyltransferase [Candidatus Omnitrophica bacterium]|nr:16S rRNA (uracil(1498)-N(3))-methyltransferase [Candidatus Omnitrophota bacterium]
MSRFYVKPEFIQENKIHIDRIESHHIIDVMRLSEGDLITVFDGSGREFEGKISSVANKRVAIDILKTSEVKKTAETGISLAQAIPKKDKMNLIVRGVTELGVRRILPVESARTVVRVTGDRMKHKVERWRKISVEAAKQCGRTELPEIRDVASFKMMLDEISGYDAAIMPCLSKASVAIKSALKKIKSAKNVLVIIGPEGGFTEEEIDAAGKKGAARVTLGPLVLKSDTAAVAAISILNHELSS